MMIYTILFLCIIRTDRLFLLSPTTPPKSPVRPLKYFNEAKIIFFERFEAVQSVQIILRGRFVSHKVVQFIFLKGLKSYKVSKLFFWSFRTTISSTRELSSPSESRNNTTNRYCSF